MGGKNKPFPLKSSEILFLASYDSQLRSFVLLPNDIVMMRKISLSTLRQQKSGT
jgi:hypothetical protein